MDRRISIGKRISNEGAMDFSWLLDVPAGKHGFLQVRDGHLYFEDGTRGKFVGFNMPVRSSMPDHEAAEILSARLASMGVNVVRLHAIDAMPGEGGWTTRPGYSIIDYEKGSSRTLNPAGLERLDYWCAKLKEKGIYLHLDLLVARCFLPGDDLDYPCTHLRAKFVSHVNRRLIALQKEYAEQLLTHVNPYTGLAYREEPQVICVQIANEDSAFFTFGDIRPGDDRYPYLRECEERFNHFLLGKYHGRKNLQEAWTFNGISGLSDQEDPDRVTVRMPEPGVLTQRFLHPMSPWDGALCPARYADFTEFLMQVNRAYYREMIDHLRGLGVRVPINTSNMSAGAADICSSMDADVMENNAYFNHPCNGPDQEHYTYSAYMREYVSTDPRKASFSSMEPRSHILTQFAPTLLPGKPFIMTEWNEYGEYPFHASAFLSTAAYACYQDIDGLIIYTYHTTDDPDGDREDEIRNVMDTFNDPSLMLQFGTMAAVFLRGLVRKAEHRVDILYSENDLQALPETHRMPFSVLPFLMGVKCLYPGKCENYEGNADAAMGCGFMAGTDLTKARHAILFSYSDWRNMRRTAAGKENWLLQHQDRNKRLLPGGVTLGDRFLMVPEMSSLQDGLDFTGFSDLADRALKHWGIIPTHLGIDEAGGMNSDTGEIRFSPAESQFRFESDACMFFAGKPEEKLMAGRYECNAGNTREALAESRKEEKGGNDENSRFLFSLENARIALALLPLDGQPLSSSRHLLMSAVGRSGMDEAVYEHLPDGPELSEKDVTRISKEGKLFMETVEGRLSVRTDRALRFWCLDVYGRRVRELPGKREGDRLCFLLDGEYFGNFEIEETEMTVQEDLTEFSGVEK